MPQAMTRRISHAKPSSQGLRVLQAAASAESAQHVVTSHHDGNRGLLVEFGKRKR